MLQLNFKLCVIIQERFYIVVNGILMYISYILMYPVHDITVCRNDDFSKWLMDEEALKNVQFVIFDEYGLDQKNVLVVIFWLMEVT